MGFETLFPCLRHFFLEKDWLPLVAALRTGERLGRGSVAAALGKVDQANIDQVPVNLQKKIDRVPVGDLMADINRVPVGDLKGKY